MRITLYKVSLCSSWFLLVIFLLLLVCVWVAAEWGGLAVHIFGDKAGLDCVGKEHGLYVLNHPGDIDFLAGLMVAYEFNMLAVSAVFVFVKS